MESNWPNFLDCLERLNDIDCVSRVIFGINSERGALEQLVVEIDTTLDSNVAARKIAVKGLLRFISRQLGIIQIEPTVL